MPHAAAHPPLLQAALIYNVLGSVTRVVRRHFIVQVYGLSGAQDRDALDAADLASWLQGGPYGGSERRFGPSRPSRTRPVTPCRTTAAPHACMRMCSMLPPILYDRRGLYTVCCVPRSLPEMLMCAGCGRVHPPPATSRPRCSG